MWIVAAKFESDFLQMKTEYLFFLAKVCSLQMGSKLLYIFEGLQMVQLLLGMLD